MDNKRVYRKIATVFWLLLATMPLWVSFFCVLFSYNTQVEQVTNQELNERFMNMYYSLFGYGTSFEEWLFPFIYTPIDNIIGILGLQDSSLALAISWFIQVYILELLIDIFVWLPKFIHRLLEKYGGVE